jgi:lipoprotein signal peptidase
MNHYTDFVCVIGGPMGNLIDVLRTIYIEPDQKKKHLSLHNSSKYTASRYQMIYGGLPV